MNNLFGADGIRSVIDRHPLRSEDAYRIGRSLAVLLRQVSPSPWFLIGTDTRESCQRLKTALIDGLTHAGVRVVDAGILPTAAISYLVASTGYFIGGAIISASHNSSVENGAKFFDERGIKLNRDRELQIENLFFGDAPLPYQARPETVVEEPELAHQYVRAMAREFRDFNWRDCRLVVDCSHGSAYKIFPEILEVLKAPYTLIHANPDGTNINWQSGSEFTRTLPNQLAERVRTSKARVGVALDGDADRMVLVDSKAHLYDGDSQLAILGTSYAKTKKLHHRTVVATEMSNSGLARYFRHQEIKTRIVENSDRCVTKALLDEDLNLGGEQIGHIIYRDSDQHVTGDGLRSTLLVLRELIQQPGLELRNLVEGLHKFPQVKASIYLGRLTRSTKEEIPGLPEMIEQVKGKISDITKFDCRPASTEPVYRIMIEARHTDLYTLAGHAMRLGNHIQSQLNCTNKGIVIFDCVNGGCLTNR